jgi:hypothetical protein
MAVLKKIKASTLMETLVATVLIVIVFMTSSMILNNLFTNNIQFNQNKIQQELHRLQYKNQNEQLVIPYYNDLGDWAIEVVYENWQGQTNLLFSAENKRTKQKLTIRR